MAIFKTTSHVEAYRAKASARDINELSGRTGRPDLTAFVTQQIVARLPLRRDAVLVDVGCGDASLLLQAGRQGLDGFFGRLIGLLPTREEVSRVRDHLLHRACAPSHLVSIEPGLADQTHIPDRYCDLLVCNGVLIVLPDDASVRAALTEFARITKPGATVYLGEIPDTDEMAGKNYGDSVSGWLLWVLKHQGLAAFWIRLRQTLAAVFSREPFVIAPKKIFHMPPDAFIALLSHHGFEVLEHHRHQEVAPDGTVRDSGTRWNFLALRR